MSNLAGKKYSSKHFKSNFIFLKRILLPVMGVLKFFSPDPVQLNIKNRIRLWDRIRPQSQVNKNIGYVGMDLVKNHIFVRDIFSYLKNCTRKCFIEALIGWFWFKYFAQDENHFIYPIIEHLIIKYWNDKFVICYIC